MTDDQTTPTTDQADAVPERFKPPFPVYMMFVVLPNGKLAINAYDTLHGDNTAPDPYKGCVMGCTFKREEATRILAHILASLVENLPYAGIAEANLLSDFTDTGLGDSSNFHAWRAAKNAVAKEPDEPAA